MTDDVLTVETKGRIRLLTLNRPDARNALNAELSEAIMAAVLEADQDPEVYVIALTGAGSAFCSGVDLRDARDLADAGKINRGPLHAARRSPVEVMIDTRKPTVAIVNGPAVAGGFELALSCDLMIAADTAFFALPESKRGRAANFATVVLPQVIPPAIAMEWLYTGRRIAVTEMERWGLVNRIVPTATLLSDAMAFLEDIVSSAPLSLQRQKLTYRKTQGMPFHAGIRLDTGPDVYGSEDQKEGARAFIEKRPPRWQGK